jgi:heme ABC exporter ATP-binding subunit CcmA
MSAGMEVRKVWKYYGDFPALRDINITASPGSCVALLGRNGAGKTTLLRIMAGLSAPARGEVLINGVDIGQRSTRQQIGVLGHGIGIYEELSAEENLILFAKLYGLEQPKQIARRWLERTGLERVSSGLAREFSRGMRQRLAIARAFLHDPGVLLLDEPFTALDDRAISFLQGLLRSALEAGHTVVMSTHQLREALELASTVTVLERGRIVHQGDRTAEMLADPSSVYRNLT